MGKRTAFEDQSRAFNSPRDSKRQKTGANHDSDAHQVNGGVAHGITSARDLQRALVFDQSSPADIRSGLSLLKAFLDSILYPTEDYDVPRKRAILREYLDTQKGRGNDAKDQTFLPNLIQTWDFAAETNAEAILAQVTAVLALLLKAFASHNDFLEYGTLLCKTILQPSVARRLVRSTSAASNKENVIAPALRLLTQLTSFNESAHARAVYTKRDFTLEPKLLGRNISLGKEQSVSDHVKKPTIRTTAIRYLLTHLRFQDERAKSEILGNTNVTRAVFDRLQTDPPFLIQEIFNVFTDHVFKDKTIARHVKSRILNGRTLSRIAALYSYDVQEGSLSEGQKAPDMLTHDFLRLVCTDPAYGVMLPTNGFYLSTFDDNDGDQEDLQEHDQMVDIISPDSKASRIRNTILSDFIHSLRPYANTLHQDLITDIFRACPELISEYFVKRRDFSYDPKLTATWIGYSAFLYQTIQLPVPKFFGWKRGYADGPPSISILMQSIMPQPLNQQVLTKCLNHSSDLVQLFAVRVLVVALGKLRDVLKEATAASTSKSSKLWGQLSKHLVTEFGRRCPPIRTLFLALKKPGLKDMKRESITRLLRLYYEILPHVALQEKFDVSLPLCSALVEVEKCAEGSEEKVFRVMELEHWTQMAKLSPAMRWWQKQKTLQHSPFVTLLKLLVTSKENELYTGIKSLLVDILQDQELLQMRTSPNALEVVLASLGPSSGSSALAPEVFDFLDDSCARFIQVPIKYFDDLDAICAQNSQKSADIGPFSPVLMTLVEQWPFKGGNAKTSASAEAIAQWLVRLLYLLKLVGEDETILQSVRDALVESADSAYKGILGDAFLWKMGKERAKESLKLATGADFSGSDRSTVSPSPPEHKKPSAQATWKVDLDAPPAEDKKHTGLTRWRKKELSEAIDDGDIGALLLCICSEHSEIRIQAVNGIRQLAASIAVNNRIGEAHFHEQLPAISNLDLDVQHMYLLLGEILESVDPSGAVAFPYVGGVLAGRIVSILADPTHSLFSTVNRFLTTSPVWNVDTLIRYFWHHIVTSEPDDDSTYHEEVDWFLDYLLDALRTGPDMEIFRKSNIFEQLLSHYASRSCSSTAKTKIVRLLLRATHVGGSTTLITRCGLITWIEITLDGQDGQHRALKTLAARLYQTCDRGRVETWSSGTLLQKIPAIVGEDTWSRLASN